MIVEYFGNGLYKAFQELDSGETLITVGENRQKVTSQLIEKVYEHKTNHSSPDNK